MTLVFVREPSEYLRHPLLPVGMGNHLKISFFFMGGIQRCPKAVIYGTILKLLLLCFRENRFSCKPKFPKEVLCPAGHIFYH